MNKDNKDKTIKYLVYALAKEGMVKMKNYRSARQHVQYWIKHDKLRLRRNAWNNYYVVNDGEIEDIIETIKQNRRNKWNYEYYRQKVK